MDSARILVSGAAGFVGSHLTRRLLAEGYTIGVILRRSSDTRRISDVVPMLQVFWADLEDLSRVRRELIEFAPDCAVDLAWRGVGNAQRNDLDQMRNLRSGFEFLQVLKAAGCRTFVGLGSQAEYGPCGCAISENYPTNPTTIYGLAKLCCSLRTREFCASNGLRFVWLRLFSCYGPGDETRWLIPYVTLALLRGDRPALTPGEQRWDFIHVRDVVEAILCVLRNDQAEGVFNLGSGEAPSLRSTIEYLRDLIDRSLPLGFGEVAYRPDQVMLLQADISRLATTTGWRPRVGLSEGLRETVEWYRRRKLRAMADV